MKPNALQQYGQLLMDDYHNLTQQWKEDFSLESKEDIWKGVMENLPHKLWFFYEIIDELQRLNEGLCKTWPREIKDYIEKERTIQNPDQDFYIPQDAVQMNASSPTKAIKLPTSLQSKTFNTISGKEYKIQQTTPPPKEDLSNRAFTSKSNVSDGPSQTMKNWKDLVSDLNDPSIQNIADLDLLDTNLPSTQAHFQELENPTMKNESKTKESFIPSLRSSKTTPEILSSSIESKPENAAPKHLSDPDDEQPSSPVFSFKALTEKISQVHLEVTKDQVDKQGDDQAQRDFTAPKLTNKRAILKNYLMDDTIDMEVIIQALGDQINKDYKRFYGF